MDELKKSRDIISQCDREIALAFARRMSAAKSIAEYKKQNSLPVYDAAREKTVIENSAACLPDRSLSPYFKSVMGEIIRVSRIYQGRLISAGGNVISVNTASGCYDITVQRGALEKAGEIFDLDRRVLIVTDSGVPERYAKAVSEKCREPYIYTIPQGESSKNPGNFIALLEFMAGKGFSRRDCIVAVGGGVPGDLAGFAASAYMRGIDFYNIPTTVLSQVDSSVGGKTAVDLGGYKNIIGAFYQPKGVIIDPDVLSTLPARQISNGLAEAVKAAMIADEEMLAIFESGSALDRIEEIIIRSVTFKRDVVEQDEKESGLRRILNFGHTIGHAIETAAEGELYHGECVALGMFPMCSEKAAQRLLPVLESLNLPTRFDADAEKFKRALALDKKGDSGSVTAIFCDEPGTCRQESVLRDELIERAKILGRDSE